MAFNIANLREKLLRNFGAKSKGGGVMMTQTGFFEINLVPDVKFKMLRLQKLYNLVLFICIVVVSLAGGATIVLGAYKGAQDVQLAGQDDKLKKMSDKVMSYEELSEFLTIQDQLGKLAKIDENKKVLSRIFSILSVLMPNAQDTLTYSELSIDLKNSTISFDAQADAKVEPKIDYRVLESFKKGVALMKYDYGRYVDAEGREIPTRCIEETDKNGILRSESGGVYALWNRNEAGCDPAVEDEVVEESAEDEFEKEDDDDKKASAKEKQKRDDNLELGERIWRTPQFSLWSGENEVKPEYGKEESEKKGSGAKKQKQNTKQTSDGEQQGKNEDVVYRPSMSLSGAISGVPHFESKCIQYSGVEEGGETKWTATNNCDMSPDGVHVTDSSNGRNSKGSLVLRFTASIVLNKDIFAFKNKHVMAIGPNNQNVTDSYVQIKGMFEERAKDCREEDIVCNSSQTNTQNSTQSDAQKSEGDL